MGMMSMVRRIGIVLLAICFLSACGRAPEESSPADVVGSWTGTLKAQGMALELVFHFSEGSDGGLEATIDSVSQGVNGIPVERAFYDKGQLLLEAEAILGFLDARLDEDQILRGTWTQNDSSFPLELTRVP